MIDRRALRREGEGSEGFLDHLVEIGGRRGASADVRIEFLEGGHVIDDGRVNGGIIVLGGEGADGSVSQVKRACGGNDVGLQLEQIRRRLRADAGDAQPTTGGNVAAFDRVELHGIHLGGGEHLFLGSIQR